MKKTFLLAIFCAFFFAATEARANIYGLIVIAENPALNLMEGTSLMLMSYEEGAYYRPYLEAYQFEGPVFRSAGSSGAFDCYPVYPGLCAIVPTQTAIDFDNPDPSILEADFYVDTVFIQQVAPGVFYGYDPAYYFGFGGGDYPPEYTFSPCWCGGYVQVVRVYLGTLAVLLPKPPFDLRKVSFTEALTETAAANVLPNEIITDMTQSIMIGTQVQVQLLFQRPVQGLVFSAEGGPIEEWVVTYEEFEDPNSKAEIKPLRTNVNPIRAMWPFGSFNGSTYKLTASYQVYGRTYTRKTFFKVFAPSIENGGLGINAVFNSFIAVDDQWDTPIALHFGQLNELNSGIRFDLFDVYIPDGFPQAAYFEWVQVVENTSRRSFANDVDTFVKSGGGLDTRYPYAAVGTLERFTIDSPGIEMNSTFPRLSVKDDFLMYLMYIPEPQDSYRVGKFVPVKEIKWGWKGDAEGTFLGTEFIDADLTNTGLIGPTIVDATRYPLWTRNWKGIPYVKQ